MQPFCFHDVFGGDCIIYDLIDELMIFDHFLYVLFLTRLEIVA